MTFQNMLTCFFLVNKSTIIYHFLSFERIAKYSIMVRIRVVCEHFSVAQTSHGQVVKYEIIVVYWSKVGKMTKPT